MPTRNGFHIHGVGGLVTNTNPVGFDDDDEPTSPFEHGSRASAPRSNMSQMAEMAREMPRRPWDEFVQRLSWKQGEHIGMIGPTGSGKTNFMTQLLPLHPYVTVFATKPRDVSMDMLIEDYGYHKLERWQKLDPAYYPRRVLWPDATSVNAQVIQKPVFKDAFERIYREGGWTVVVDELWVFENDLKLGHEIKVYLLQARSLDISLVAGAQRPAWVPRELYTSCTHLMFWRCNDENDLRSISGIGYLNSSLIRYAVARLDKYQALYINTRTGEMCRTTAPDGQLGG